ncbi:hypothetical protein PHYBLDRAFT_150653 [Phycomyces blakesleeanus NRRL 1555(-)]|uniref:Uncharacterized protein n=1 Tax=Phycomyces blakesleeanus (strain ATCC 8743b / DSM 1359 / FGSC 10004 / NBRC 33097 / NRRL 1555) TaxID=763407 RepID=A0A163D3M7_PHYB8|nr:hypothetical protein PHYBLDRAFT_150653 [Phycomyces blakesleeanus NRRL 1555(-)]OAD68480.1 hypothetical protein PHYBLDRAFT_150653 [Phycomyces blakesleeanus NRRL 1555(-)]|eukprot:XP_018286520.1 hypothetical protein PHYBLDRAFT_150653 [Phycomyces blakesleeanus NRRL 1555(-)]
MSVALFTFILDTTAHKKIIDAYPPIQDMIYSPPATLPVALAQFKPHQNLRSLLVHTSASITQSRNELAMHHVHPPLPPPHPEIRFFDPACHILQAGIPISASQPMDIEPIPSHLVLHNQSPPTPSNPDPNRFVSCGIISDRFQIHFNLLSPLLTHSRPTIPMDDSQRHLLCQEIAKLLHKKGIEPAPLNSPGFNGPVFVIFKKNGGYRPVFNLKHLNKHLTAPHFKIETLQAVCKFSSTVFGSHAAINDQAGIPGVASEPEEVVSPTISLPETKLYNLCQSIRQLITNVSPSPRLVYSLTMRIQAATIALFPACLYTQHLIWFKNKHVHQNLGWDMRAILDKVVLWAPTQSMDTGHMRKPRSRWLTCLPSNGTGHNDLEMVYPPWSLIGCTAHCREGQCHCRSGISPDFYEDPLETLQGNIQYDTVDVVIQTLGFDTGTTQCGPLPRSDHSSSSHVCVLAPRPKGNSFGCNVHLLEPIEQLLSQPLMKPDWPVSAQDMAGELEDDLGGSNLAECHMISSSPEDVGGSSPNYGQSVHSFRLLQNPMAVEELNVEACCIQTIKCKFNNTGLTNESVLLLIDSALTNTLTNRIYQWGQHLFIATIKNHHTAALKLHINPKSLCCHEDVQTVFSCLALQAPPLRQTRPSIDFASTLDHVASIVSATSTSLTPLSRKTAFLIVMTAFLHLSNLARLQLLSARVDISSDADYSRASTARPPQHLFVNAHQPMIPVQISTISSWLRSLLQLSMHESVLVQSIAFTLVLEHDMSLNNIVTLGNWSSCEVFQQYYSCNHTSSADFTNIVLRPSASVLVSGLVVPTIREQGRHGPSLPPTHTCNDQSMIN